MDLYYVTVYETYYLCMIENLLAHYHLDLILHLVILLQQFNFVNVNRIIPDLLWYNTGVRPSISKCYIFV